MTLAVARAASLVVSGLLLAATCPAERRPNVVFVLADDLGYGDLASYGHAYARTPNLDELAREGTSFRQFYVTGASCAPSRAGFMTGRFLKRSVARVAGSGGGLTVNERLHGAGYRTGHFGKWHLGLEPCSGVLGIDRIERPPTTRDDPRGRDFEVFEAAMRFVEQSRSEPFYVNVWTTIAHAPIQPAPSLVALFADVRVDRTLFHANAQANLDRCVASGCDLDVAMREYLAELYALDMHVGRLLRKIDDLGLRNDTIVVFASDNGPPSTGIVLEKEKADGRRPTLNSVGNSGKLRGQKLTLFEGGIRVPFIVRWPGHVPAGRVDTASVLSGADWAPTLCALAGVRVDPGDYDGEDVSDIWLGGSRSRSRPLLWRVGRRFAIRDGRFKLLLPRHEAALYDLSVDPGERNDIADTHRDVVARLRALIEAHTRNAPPTDNEAGADEEDDEP